MGGELYVASVTGYSPFAVAKFFIEKASELKESVTPMKLIKLSYIAHGWHLAVLDTPLINENVQAWKYGPVFESLYHAFKRFGNNPIPPNAAMEFNYSTSDFEPKTRALLEKVWEKYSPLNALQLSALTHQQGTPWYDTWEGTQFERQNVVISNDAIKVFYKGKTAQTSGSGH